MDRASEERTESTTEASLESPQDDGPKPRIQTAVRTIAILLAVAESSNGMKAKEISEKLGLSRQVSYHLIHTMRSTGILRKDERNKYVLGFAVIAIVEGFSRQLAPLQHLDRRIRRVVTATGESAYASGWVNGEIVALATAAGESTIRAAQVTIGYSGYAHARAAGKLLLALANPDERAAYLSKHALEPRTKRTITTDCALMQDLEVIRANGYALDNEEFHEGLRCLAVPVQGTAGRYALTISVPEARFENNFARYLAVLLDMARVDI
jgi:IclR family acetate operon transcriptional repressor